MWLTVYFIPFLKYPANPPTVGDAETVVLRGILYLSFIAISGFAAVGFYKLSKVFEGKKKIISLIGYAALISIVFFVMPDNPDENTAPVSLVEGFRIMSVLGVSTFWIAIGLVFGFLWGRFNPNKEVPSFN
jgi:predicted cobalt transporter CbtA